MQLWPVVFGFLILLGVLVPASGSAVEKLVFDPRSGCLIRDPDPGARRDFRWTGPCRDGFAHGRGVLEWTVDGRLGGWLEGGFVNGRPEGEARVKWQDGRTFTGTYRQGLASGYGTLGFADGHRYVGSFARDRPTGDGAFISSMGTRYAARLDEDGGVRPGAMLGPEAPAPAPAKPGSRHKAASPLQAAEAPPFSGEAPPGSLEEWLRKPLPVPQRAAGLRPSTGNWATGNWATGN